MLLLSNRKYGNKKAVRFMKCESRRRNSDSCKCRFVKPLMKMLDRLAKEHSLLVTMEENIQKGGFAKCSA